MRAYELARELHVDAREVVRALDLSSHLASVTPAQVAQLRLDRPRRYPRFKRPPGPRPVSFRPPFNDDEWLGFQDELERVSEWSTGDAALYFGVTQATIRQWVKRGYITPIRSERGSNVFRSYSVIEAHAAILARTNKPPGRRANIHPRHHHKLVSTAVAARAVGVAPSTVRSWISRGLLKPTRDETGRVLVLVADVFSLARR